MYTYGCYYKFMVTLEEDNTLAGEERKQKTKKKTGLVFII